MKKIKLFAVIAILTTVVFGMGVMVGANNSSQEPGSVGDPLVTKSYLEKMLKENGGGNTTAPTVASGDGVFKRELLSAGKTLTAAAGAEVMLYSGAANVVTKYKAGVINLSTNKVAANKAKVVQYHTYLIAGRSSIKTTQRSYIYVKGNYTIK